MELVNEVNNGMSEQTFGAKHWKVVFTVADSATTWRLGGARPMTDCITQQFFDGVA